MSIIYAIVVVISIGLFVAYCSIVGKREPWLLLLYLCITVVNIGYFLVSVSSSVTFAIIANDVAYFGSVFLSMCMFLTIVRLCGFKVNRKLVIVLALAAVAMFSVVATSGILPWYYKELSLEFVDGATKLVKVYGVLHPLYMIYLFAYFAAMVACIIISSQKKTIVSEKHAILMAAIVLGNIGVWFLEKFITWNFEFLSISYLFSEVMLLGIYWMIQEYDAVYAPEKKRGSRAGVTAADIATMSTEEKMLRVLSSLPGDVMLTSRENEILELMLQHKRRKDIASELNLSENTVKTYTRTLYGKLSVGSREDIFSLLLKYDQTNEKR